MSGSAVEIAIRKVLETTRLSTAMTEHMRSGRASSIISTRGLPQESVTTQSCQLPR